MNPTNRTSAPSLGRRRVMPAGDAITYLWQGDLLGPKARAVQMILDGQTLPVGSAGTPAAS